MSTDKPMSHLSFKGMSIALLFRDIFNPPHKILHQIDLIKQGTVVLDYGCGPGSYTIAAAQIVGPSGKVYAVDIHPMAILEVQKKADMKELKNIQTILADSSRTKLPDSSVDVVLLFYVLHDFKNPDSILEELNRILRHKGILSVIDHKLDNDKVVAIIERATRGDLRLGRTGKEATKKKESLLIFCKE